MSYYWGVYSFGKLGLENKNSKPRPLIFREDINLHLRVAEHDCFWHLGMIVKIILFIYFFNFELKKKKQFISIELN